MTRMSGNDKSTSRDFGDSSQFTNWILDSSGTCHMTPQVSDFPQALYKIRINILKLRVDITSWGSKKDKFK